MTNLHLITHTHWDREWYLPFQEFRLKLVNLVDKLLSILDSDEHYLYFMLDGQTIVLEDYLEIRPQDRATLEKYIQTGRIQVGPWYILPDEFLVSGEAIIRNLLVGKKLCEQFGKRMMIGYIPDPFGHIGQMPQILQGFGIKYACFRRGLADEPVELWWESPDGSKVLTSYLRDGYDNAVNLPLDSRENFYNEVNRLADSLKPFIKTDNLLLMNGSDHIEPDARTPEFVAYFNENEINDRLIHSTLENYFATLESAVKDNKLELAGINGELRECKRHELLPAVLSSRNWIKQRNHECEQLLEKWTEPFSACSLFVDGFSKEKAFSQNQVIEYAWKSLLKCQPHDSICGCSIDQVHKEMVHRFDEVEQIGNRVTLESLTKIAQNVNTNFQKSTLTNAIVVFNASQYSQTGMVMADVPLPAGVDAITICDSKGNAISTEFKTKPWQSLAELKFDRESMRSAIYMLSEGKISGMSVLDIGFTKYGKTMQISLVLDKNSLPNFAALENGKSQIIKYLEDESIEDYSIIARTPIIYHVQWLAEKVPGFGYKTYWIVPGKPESQSKATNTENSIENEFIQVSVDYGSNEIHLLDKKTGFATSGLLQFEDSGDSGDEYNFNPPEENKICNSKIVSCSADVMENQQRLHVVSEMLIPESLSEDRKSRATANIRTMIQSEITLTKGIPRVDIRTKLTNQSKDHRLRVFIPTGIHSNSYITDNQFIQSKREIVEIQFKEGWVEQPRPEVPQKLFTYVSDEERGILVANHGMPEVEVFKDNHNENVIALTLLRCTGWLSRDDLRLRPHTAGPVVETPEAQEQGAHEFSFSIIPFGASVEKAIEEAHKFDLRLKAIVTDLHEGKLASEMSFLTVQPADFEITACKIAEDNSSCIIRGVNQNTQTRNVTMNINLPITNAYSCRMDESITNKLTMNENEVNFETKPHQINTIRLD